MAGFTTYTTTGGETWNLVAYKAYGTFGILLTDDGPVDTVQAITDANPDCAIATLLDAGLVLQIPVLSIGQASIDQSKMPYWKV